MKDTPGSRRSGIAVAVAAAVLAAAGAHAQQFQHTYSTPDEERTEWTVETSDGGLAACGYRVVANDGQALVAKFDGLGNVQWARIFGGQGFDVASRVIETSDGGYLVVGETSSTAPGFGMFAVKLSSAGGLLWTHAYEHSPFAGGIMGGVAVDEVRNDPVGGFVLAGRKQLAPNSTQSPSLVRIDPGGGLLWHVNYSDPRYGGDHFGAFADVHALADGTIIAAGYSGNQFSGSSRDTYLLRVNAVNGTPIWSKTYGFLQHHDTALALDPAANGDFVVAGFSKEIGEGGGTYIMRTDNAGTLLSWKVVTGFNVIHGSLEELPAGDLVLAGTVQFSNDASLLRTDGAGNPAWCWGYGASMNDFGEGVALMPGGGFVVAAWTASFGASIFDWYFIRTDPGGASGCNEYQNQVVVTDQSPFETPIESPFDRVTEDSIYPDVFTVQQLLLRDLCGTPPADPCVEPPAGMTAWWPLDELAGPWANEIVNNRDGRWVGMPSPVSGEYVDNALCFNGVNQYVHVPHHPVLNVGAGDFTIDAWVRTTSTAGVRVIAEKRAQPISGVEGYSFYISGGNLGLQLATGGGNNSCGSTGSACTNYGSAGFIADGQWRHVAVTVDRDNPTGIVWYIDGVPVATADPTGRAGSLDNTGPFRIGCRSISISGVWDGCIDEVELFRRALAPDEIAAIADARRAGKCKQRCHVPWDRAFCRGENAIIVPITVCNDGTSAALFNLSFAPEGTGPGCTIPGPTVFTPQTSLPVSVAPGACITIPVQIQRPAGMNAAYQIACYQVTLTNLTTGGVTHCRGSVQDRRDLCAVIVVGPGGIGGVIGVEPGVAVPLSFDVINPEPEPVEVPFRIRAFPSEMDQDAPQLISLDGLPPGEPVGGVIDLLGNETRRVTVDALMEAFEPFEFYDIVFETDLDNDGAWEAVISQGIGSASRNRGVCPGDYNGDGVRDTADFFEFFADFFSDPPDADYNGDSATNTSDFFEFFADFFGPPCA